LMTMMASLLVLLSDISFHFSWGSELSLVPYAQMADRLAQRPS
jgi:hypothetical protein